jgi:hypothetical protein
MPRKRRAFYLSDDETACIAAEAKKRGYKSRVGSFVRDVILFFSGWQGYSGPLFAPGKSAGRTNLLPLAMVVDDLRKLHEWMRFVRQAYETKDPQSMPDPETLRMLLKRMQALLGYSHLSALRYFPDSLDMVSRMAHNAHDIARSNPIFGNEMLDGARSLYDILEPSSKAGNG